MSQIDRDSVLALAKGICVPTKDGEYRHRCIDPLDVMELPSARHEVTEEEVKEYCRKRCLTIVTNEFFYYLTKGLSSVQQEPLTDKEQRIFLAAIGREEEVCKQVDDECRNCREPYEDSLVRTCHEITRKVKGALWMIQSADKLQ